MNHALPEPPLGALTTADLVAIVSPAARHLLVAALEALRKNRGRSRRFLARAEEASGDERELCYTLHIASMILSKLGDLHDAVKKDTRCLELCARLGLKELQSDALSHLSCLYRSLGRADLAKAYALEAEGRREQDVNGPACGRTQQPGLDYIHSTVWAIIKKGFTTP